MTSTASQSTTDLTEWYSVDDVDVSQISVLDAVACGFIDINGNGRFDLNEPLAQSTLAMGTAVQFLENF